MLAKSRLDIAVRRDEPFGTEEVGREVRDGALVRDITFRAGDPHEPGRRIAAYLVSPIDREPVAGILYVHWYEPESPDSNRTQFLDEAGRMAREGVTSLLVETIWSRPEWYGTRSLDGDFHEIDRQLADLSRALDLLVAQPGVQAGKVALVGHDFGGMWGALLAGNDERVGTLVVTAATPLFSDWYLFPPYNDQLAGERRVRYLERLLRYDPALHIANVRAATLFQFGTDDPYVSEQKALDFYAAAPDPKRLEWYATGHAVDSPEAPEHRLEWLRAGLDL